MKMLKAERKLSGSEHTPRDDEAAMLERLRRGEPIAARDFYDRYGARIQRFIIHTLGPHSDADAEDILQETFMALAEALPFFRGQSSLFTFACAIAHRKTSSFIRTRARRGRLLLEDSIVTRDAHHAQPEIAPSPDEDLRQALGSLSADHREVLMLKYVEDLRVAEIARVLSVSEHAAESRLARARRALGKALE